MKKVLLIHYSQSGQLTRIMQSFTDPLKTYKEIQLVCEELRPVKPYPFPWPFFKFLDVFPECLSMTPSELSPPSFDSVIKFDLVILAYQVWYLSPSLPVTAFLKSPWAAVLKDTPVITVIGCRDMWLTAQEKVKACLAELSAKLIDNVVFVDQGPRHATFITTPIWLWTGKKEVFGKLLPPAGVSKKDITSASRFGKAIVSAFEKGDVGGGRSILSGLGAVHVDANNIRFERGAHRNLRFWGSVLRFVGKPGDKIRLPFLVLFVVYLACMILVSLPFTVIFNCFVNPFRKKALFREVAYYEQPSGASTERMEREWE